MYDARRRWPAGGPGAAVVAVDGLDLAIRRGECFGLLGPNGAGKTTTVEILEGLLEPSAGEVELLGMSWARDDVRLRERIGVALQETRLPERLIGRRRCWTCSAASTGARGRSPRCWPTSSWRRSATPGSASCRADSGSGWRSPARWSASPTSCSSTSRPPGSIPSRAASCGTWCCASAAAGGTVVLTTHYMEEAERLCDRVADHRSRPHHQGGIAGGADPRPGRRARDRVRRSKAGAALVRGRPAGAAGGDGRAAVRRRDVRADRVRAGARAAGADHAGVGPRRGARRGWRRATRRWRTCSSR